MAGKRGYRAARDYDPRRGGKKSAGGKSARSSESRAVGSKKTAPNVHARSEDTRASSKRGAGAHDNGAKAAYSATGQPGGRSGAAVALPDTVFTSTSDVAGLSFGDLGLGGNIVRALSELGAERPFAIQAATIPDAIAGKNVLGRGRTGSGKTIAFGAALVERLLRLKASGAFGEIVPRQKPKRGSRTERTERGGSRAPKALILAPTRELALQIDRTVQPIARSVGLFTGQFVGGQPFEPQLHALRRGVDIVIGTPGRIEDLTRRGHLDLSGVQVTVIDEADHMAELGFIDAVRWVLSQTRRDGQRMLFSATLDRGVDALVAEYLPRPVVHAVRDEAGGLGASGRGDATGGETLEYAPLENVEHRVLLVLREHKDDAIVQLARSGGRAIVFCRTRAYAELVTGLLTEAGVRAVPLHGDLSQARRERNLAQFTAGKARVLVATDIAARGIHVDDVELVLQADPPDDAKSYIHRAGRTGRALSSGGRVLTLIPRTRQKRTRELFEALGFEPAFFGDFTPNR